MTMRPAPKNETGIVVCDIACGECRPRGRSWHWKMVTLGSCVVEFCPDCGRALGFDADGNPVVGASPQQLERAGKQLAFRLFSIAQGGHQHKACTNQTRDAIWQQELAATEEAADVTE